MALSKLYAYMKATRKRLRVPTFNLKRERMPAYPAYSLFLTSLPLAPFTIHEQAQTEVTAKHCANISIDRHKGLSHIKVMLIPIEPCYSSEDARIIYKEMED